MVRPTLRGFSEAPITAMLFGVKSASSGVGFCMCPFYQKKQKNRRRCVCHSGVRFQISPQFLTRPEFWERIGSGPIPVPVTQPDQEIRLLTAKPVKAVLQYHSMQGESMLFV